MYTVRALYDWSRARGVELPITEAVYRVVYEKEDPIRALSALMGRELKPE